MQILNETSMKILFVIDENERLLGTITDGDIRRGIINGMRFGDRVENVMHRDFIAIGSSEAVIEENTKQLMIENNVEQIPVLNNAGRIINVLLWTDLFGKKPSLKKKQFFTNTVIIMAGGKGTRLDPFTKILPKPLIPIDEKPIVEIIMEKFYNYGFRNFIFTLNYKKEYIKMFLSENDFPYNIDWVEENNYMGTAGSLSLLRDKINDTFFVSNCDIILNVDYADVLKWHKENGNLMTLVGCYKEVKIPYGILEMDNGVLKNFVEKPNYDVLINTGVYVLESEVIHLIPKDKPSIDMNNLVELASRKGQVSVYPISDGWFDVGQWDEYRKSVKALSDE